MFAINRSAFLLAVALLILVESFGLKTHKASVSAESGKDPTSIMIFAFPSVTSISGYDESSFATYHPRGGYMVVVNQALCCLDWKVLV
jgi:hypothetical protein